MRAIFRTVGKYPLSMHELKILVRGAAIMSETSFIMKLGISRKPPPVFF